MPTLNGDELLLSSIKIHTEQDIYYCMGAVRTTLFVSMTSEDQVVIVLSFADDTTVYIYIYISVSLWFKYPLRQDQ